jgi:SAM-dependent methyltransferase
VNFYSRNLYRIKQIVSFPAEVVRLRRNIGILINKIEHKSLVDETFKPHMLPHLYGGDIDSVNERMIRNRNKLIGEFVNSGTGLEIGALHNPTPLSENVNVSYVDYLSASELKKRYQEYSQLNIVEPDIIDDGERLSKVKRNDLDFIIANHFIEHCQNPILAIENMLSKLRLGGIIVLAVHDKRYTFDVLRKITDFDHLVRDYEEGPEWSHRGHYEDFAAATCHINERTKEDQFEYYYNNIKDIHFHVWDYYSFFNFIDSVKQRYKFPLELIFYIRNGFENVCIIQKQQ